MDILINGWLKEAVNSLYGVELEDDKIEFQATRKEFEGDVTALLFSLSRVSRKAPEATAEEIGAYLKERYNQIEGYNVIKGFLNLKFTDSFWLERLKMIAQDGRWGFFPENGKSVMVEYSSPNTNKPLHLGHIRNILLGWSLSKLLEANGYNVIKTNLVNDRGIHICKSMVAWQRVAEGATPESTSTKGDHFVGQYYVAFNQLLQEEKSKLIESGVNQEEAEEATSIMRDARQLLIDWESGESKTVELWKRMNGWVYEGFDQTYDRMGVSFDKIYYESETYLLGKAIVDEGLERGVFYQKEDGSVWCDLTEEGLDHKLLLRADGTSVYMTQDLGTADQRFSQYELDQHIYVVGNEQNYHFKVLQVILKKLGFDWADTLYHLSYGMVELPDGKMKSREGTVVDADELIDDMVTTAKASSMESGKLDDMEESDREKLYEVLAMGALKYFILRVDPKRTMLFDPSESIDFNGNTGPFIQYTHARICSILRRAEGEGLKGEFNGSEINEKERELIKLLNSFPSKVEEAGTEHSPAVIASYIYDLAKEFSQYYHETSIMREEQLEIKVQRLYLIEQVATILQRAATLLGFELPERM